MKNKVLQNILVCSLALLLILGLSAGVVGLSLSGVRIVREPAEEVRALGTVMEADLTSRWYGVELDPETLYDRACSQTVYIYWEGKLEDGGARALSGSGIIITNDGYILTNAHCITDAQSVGESMQVELYDGRTFEGQIVGADTETDIGLLKIEAQGLQAATISSASPKNCQKIYVMGHPDENLKFSMTTGIISGLDRVVEFSDGTVLDMFQIDAAVNPGNSGGPAFDAYGNVIGMVTAKYVSLTTEGIGFAIPVKNAISIAEYLKEYGYVPGRPLFGITVMNVTEGLIRPESPAGAMVYSAEPGLPGEQAGFIKGDIIVSIDGKTVASLDDLSRIKQDYRAGDTVLIRFWRDGEYLETTLTFAEETPEHPTGPVTIEEEPEEGGEEAPPAAEDMPEIEEETPPEDTEDQPEEPNEAAA